MFTDGKSYGEFLKRECLSCPFFTPWDKATRNKPTCQIENKLAYSVYTGHPSELLEKWIQKDEKDRFVCKKKPQMEEIA